jgi:two-component system response regulator HydG
MSEKLSILIVDDDRRMANTLRDIFKIQGYEAEVAYSAPEALDRVKESPFDCLLTDVKMPEMSGLELSRAVKSLQPKLPVMFMTAYSTDKLVQEGLEEGGVAVLTKPLDINLLLGLVSCLRKELSLVIVNDDPMFCKTLGDVLRSRGYVVTQVSDPHGLADKLTSEEHVVLLDMKFPDTTGLEALKELRGRYPHLAVVLVTGYGEEMAPAIEAALKINAYTCLYKPIEMEKLLDTFDAIRQQELDRFVRGTHKE